MAGRVYVYDPEQVVMVLGVLPIDGDFADGTFVRVERKKPRFVSKEGCDGEVIRKLSLSSMGTLKFTLAAFSLFNAALSALLQADVDFEAGIVPFFLRDRNGFDLGFATHAYIIGEPPMEKGNEVADGVEWELDLVGVEIYHAGMSTAEIQQRVQTVEGLVSPF